MDCTESRLLMTARIDGELDASATAQFVSHLAACPDCAKEYQAVSRLSSDIRTQGVRYAAPPHLKRRIMAAIPHKPGPERKPARWSWTWINFGAAVVSSAAFIVTLGLYLAAPSATQSLDDQIVASHYRSLLVDHLTDIASSDQHTVKPWFTGKLDFSPPTYDFASQGYTLIGGRLDYLQGRTVAALAYQHRRHVINLFIWPDTAQERTTPQPESKQGFQLLAWTDHGLRYWAISDAAAHDLAEFRDLLESRQEKE